ncbi:MAG: hypothetical protein MUF15_25525, partial [Acidobacteria bacterium]|nr:hypothetical protein [Acidobacteriota bacterium]
EKVMRFVILRLDDRLRKANKLIKKWKRMEKMSKRASEGRDENLGHDTPGHRRDEEDEDDMEVDDEE